MSGCCSYFLEMYWRIDEERDICVDFRKGSDKMLELWHHQHALPSSLCEPLSLTSFWSPRSRITITIIKKKKKKRDERARLTLWRSNCGVG